MEVLRHAPPIAITVELGGGAGVVGAEVAALAKRALLGRVVMPGSAVGLTVLGAPRFLRVRALRAASVVAAGAVAENARAMRVNADTAVTFTRADSDRSSVGRQTRTLAQLGGLERRARSYWPLRA